MPKLWPAAGSTAPARQQNQNPQHHQQTFPNHSKTSSATPPSSNQPPPPSPPPPPPLQTTIPPSSSASATLLQPPPPEKRPRRVELIVKLGGSALTVKSKPHTLHSRRFEDSIITIARLHHSGIGLLVVHGAGSFGHFEAHQHNIQSGAASPLGVSSTHATVTTLNSHVVNTLISKGVPAVGVSPLLVPGKTRNDFIAALLDRGHLPILHGDTCYAGDGRTAIISGDALIVSLCSTFQFVNRVVFLTNVDGLLKKPPAKVTRKKRRNPHHTLNDGDDNVDDVEDDDFPNINVDYVKHYSNLEDESQVVQTVVVNEAGDILMDLTNTSTENRRRRRRTAMTNLNSVQTNCLPHDATGGMNAKIMSASKCAAETGGRVTAFIARVGSQAAEIVLANRPERAFTSGCTRICYQPDGGLPPINHNELTAGHLSPPNGIDRNAQNVPIVISDDLAQMGHQTIMDTDGIIIEGNKKSKGRNSLPKRSSGLSDRSRRKAWFS